MMNSGTFWRTVISGFIATFTMAMIAFLQGGIGLPTIDVGHILKQSFNQVHVTEPYTLLWGNTAYFIVGILLALIWVVFLQKRIPGNWLIQGLIYGLLISIVAGLIVAPIVSLAAGDSFGIFYTDTWIPGRVMIAGLIMHLGYGIILTLCLKYAGVNGIEVESLKF
jgi:hypothetical protein